MSFENDLLRLAREREAKTEADLVQMFLEPPDLLRQLRAYLTRQVDFRRIKRTNERILQIATLPNGLNQVACPEIEFSSGARLKFDIELKHEYSGWLVRRFRFHVDLPQPRKIEMVLIHLNPEMGRDPLAVPRCHMHIGDTGVHLPFPVMDPRLILHLICEHVEPDFGV